MYQKGWLNIDIISTLSIIIDKINSLIWGTGTVLLIFCTGIYFTIRTGFFQFRKIRVIFSETLFSCRQKSSSTHTVTQFQALSTALAASMGTGNIVGVASAIALGGPGAVFWMWVSAFFGMATAYAENVLGVYYKQKSGKNALNGPMLYLEHGLKSKPAAVIYAFSCMIGSFGIGNMTQANAISEAAFTSFAVPKELCGIVICVLAGIVILGESMRTAKVTEKIIPFISLFYILGSIILIVVFYKEIPSVMSKIFTSAFGLRAAAGGTAGFLIKTAVTTGLKRGIFSNEAGLGSSVLVHTAADCKEPVKMGMWAIAEVFIDTIVCCTVTALVILCTKTPVPTDAGVSVVIDAFSTFFGGFAEIFITVSTTVFAFATLLGWSFYGVQCAEYLCPTKRKIGLALVYKLVFIGLIYIGSITAIKLVWSVSDVFNGLMLIPNLIAILFLSKDVVDITRKYTESKK